MANNTISFSVDSPGMKERLNEYAKLKGFPSAGAMAKKALFDVLLKKGESFVVQIRDGAMESSHDAQEVK